MVKGKYMVATTLKADGSFELIKYSSSKNTAMEIRFIIKNKAYRSIF